MVETPSSLPYDVQRTLILWTYSYIYSLSLPLMSLYRYTLCSNNTHKSVDNSERRGSDPLKAAAWSEVFMCLCVSVQRALGMYMCAQCVYSICLQLCCVCGSWQKDFWCCSSSVPHWGPVLLLLSSLPLISKTQPDRSVPALIRLPGSSLCVAGRATKSEHDRNGRLLIRYILYVCGAWLVSSCVYWPSGRTLVDVLEELSAILIYF